jgi:hypothetical protein
MEWQHLTELEPRLIKLEEYVMQQKKVHDPNYCSNWAWGLFKPRVMELVGHVREPVAAGAQFMTAADLMTLSAAEKRQQESNAGLDVLYASEAYDCAVQHLYGLLPNCRHQDDCRG